MSDEELAPLETHIKPTAPSKLNIRHDADAEFESWMEEALATAEAKLMVDPDNRDFVDEAIQVISAVKDFMCKYADDGANSLEVRLANDALNTLKGEMSYVDESVEAVAGFNKELFSKLHLVYGFGLPRKQNRNWREKVARLMQLNPKNLTWDDPIFSTPRFTTEVRHDGIRLFQYCNMVDNHVLKDNRDWVHIIAGQKRFGKSTLMLRILLNILKLRGEDIESRDVIRYYLTNNVLYQDESSASVKSLNLEKSILCIDEGWQQAQRTSWWKDQAQEIATTWNIGASKNNIYLFCISDVEAATLAVQKVADAYSDFKHRGDAELYVKAAGGGSPSKDPFYRKKMNQSENPDAKDFWSTYNPLWCGRLKSPPLGTFEKEEVEKDGKMVIENVFKPYWIYKEYETIKKAKQGILARQKEAKKQSEDYELELVELGLSAYMNKQTKPEVFFSSMEPPVPANMIKKLSQEVLSRAYFEMRDKRLRELKKE